METRISQYEIHKKLYESQRTLVYRGHRLATGDPVVLKILKPEAATKEELTRFRREFNLLSRIDLPGVIKPYGLEDYRESLMMVLEDIGGKSLDRFSPEAPLALGQFIELAIGLANAIGGLHQIRIIHKNINPAHIVFNPQTGRFSLIDFGVADELPQCTIAALPPTALEGALAYISPEQTGRMNRAVDYRTDFYSLGMIFYRILTRKLPFEAGDALGMVHWHIAGTPVAPHLLDPRLPEMISRIVMKLMAKMAEDRYQSGSGLKADLERCRSGLTSGLADIPRFELGLEDFSDQLQIPRKLYGREEEAERLLKAFERASAGARELFLVAGYAGVGKTALVHEMHKPVLEKRGYFIEGKFDQLQRNVPYFGWIQAFEGFVNYILMESEAHLGQWKENILGAVRSSGKVLTDVIPNLELIIGPQPAVPELGGIEAQNRFNYVFLEFVKTVATGAHPLVVFLDDLQWIDEASLRLMQALVSGSGVSCILVIGAYRDNEVDALHPLMKSIEALEREETSSMTLDNLPEQDVCALIADTLRYEYSQTIPLAALIYSKTGGNAFFTLETIKTLVEQQAISFDFHRGCWQWDISTLEGMEITDNVVALMIGKIQGLIPETRQLLPLAACMGFRFNLSILGIIARQSEEAARERLLPALREGLIVPVNGSCQFVHDRVQQAAYLLIPDADRKKVHLEIGRLLCQRLPEHDQEEQLFTIADHWNTGAGLLETTDDKLKLARLDLRAGLKARASAAYCAAAKYFEAGVALLEEKSWAAHYSLALELHTLAAEAASLTGDFERTDLLFAAIARNARNAVDMVGVYESRMHSYVSQGKLQEVLDVALEILEKLGLVLPSHPTEDDIQRGVEETESLYADIPIESLAGLPCMTDRSTLAMARVAAKATAAAYLGRPALFLLLILKEVSLSIGYGNATESPYFYAVYAVVLCGVKRDYDAGYRFGKLAAALLESADNGLFRSKIIEVVNGHVWHFKEHLRTTLEPLETGYRSGLEAGDLEYAGYNAFFHCCNSYFAGTNLRQLERTMASYNEALRRIWAETARRWLGPYWQAAQNLLGRSDNPCLLVGEGFDQNTMLPILEQTHHTAAMAAVHVNRLVLCFLFADYRQALESAELAAKNKEGMRGMFSHSTAIFYDSLTRLQLFPGSDAAEQSRILEKVSDNQREMKHLADHAPMNYLHKWHLVEAERLRVTGQSAAALDCYDSAISLAGENEYIQEEALGNELAARFWLGRGKEDIARLYMVKARHCYDAWGAERKVQDLQERYPQLLAAKADKQSPGLTSELLDLSTVMKAAHAISREMELDRLLGAVMRIAIENAGAQRGSLILEKEGELLVAAKGEIGTAEVEISLGQSDLASPGVILFVARTKERVVLDDAANQGEFVNDPHIVRENTKSLLCAPILSRGRLIGVLYLENNLTTRAFTPERVRFLEMLFAQMATSLENALVYEALRESEAKYRRLVDTANEGIWALGLDNNTIFVNARMAELLGYSTEEMLGLPPTGFMFEEDGPDHLKRMENLRQGLPEHYERRFRRRDGQTLWTLASATPIFDDEHRFQGSFAMLTDISKRKRAEAALEESEKSFRTLAESVPQMVWATLPDGWHVYFNQRWVDYTGMTLEESCGHGWKALIHPDDRQRSSEAWQLAMEHDDIYSLEARLRRADGVYRWWLVRGVPLRDATGKTIKWFGTCTDIHDLKLAEEQIRKLNADLEQRVQERTRELAKSEDRFRTIYNTAPVSIWQEDWTEVAAAIEDLRSQGVTDFAAHFRQHPEFVAYAQNAVKILDVNQWTPGMFAAKDKAELLASLGTVFATPDALPGFAGKLAALARGETVYRAEMTFNTVKGDLLHTLLSMSFPPPGSVFDNVLMSVVDITQRKLAERKAREALEKEVVLRREIHHRVKNNLQVIISLLYLQSIKAGDPASVALLKESQARVRSIALVHEMLYQREDLAKISFNDYVRQLAVDLFVAYRVSQRDVAMKIGADGVFLDLTTAIPCGIIVTELITNALKYAFPDGANGEIEISLLPAPETGKLALIVRDSGVGLPKGLDVKRAQTMGLCLVHDLTRQLGGVVEFKDDSRGHGTLVEIVFPEPVATRQALS